MRILIQRVSKAAVTVDQEIVSSIGKGILLLLGIEDADTDADIEWLVNKIIRLRIFDDENGVMNLSLDDIKGEAIVVSQFTLHANTKKGNRPSYIRASKPDFARPMYEKFIQKTEEALGRKVGTGVFGAMMEVSLVNDGPVTIFIDSKNRAF
ncbi:MAG: D-tyrosyl-tRNA(Tyr) deacylase [Draconibacterium sp.]|nr:MAG: D-tyrosyl-tRNA(Tyr) deacylase [Draconibacterium sp.]